MYNQNECTFGISLIMFANGKSMQVLHLEVYLQKPTFQVFLMTQNLDGKSWLSERLLLVINSMMDMFMSIISYKYKYQLKKSVKNLPA